jgi:hypothetical protein
MRVKQASSVALFLMFLLLGQSIAANLNQIPSENVDTSLDSSAIVMASNNSSGNNTGGNNSGGNGNNTGGNNTGGNNTGGNNSGGNNTGSNNDSHCLIVDNVSVNITYVATLDLVNICNYSLNYPGVNASANHPGVSGFYNGTEWYYLIGSNGTYNMSWQLSFDQSVANGSYITLYFEATILNCGGNNSYHDCPNSNDSTLTHQFFFISNSGNSGNNTGGNNTGGNSPVITVTGATNNSSYQVSNWNFNYSVSNYEGDVYWNATSENGMLYSSWSTYANLTSYQTTSQENFYQNGNYTVCASINAQVNGSNSTVTLASDCMAIYVYIAPPNITIIDATNSSSNQVTNWNFNYSVSNYYGYIYWNATLEDGTLSSSWTSRIYSNSYQTTSQENFYQSGNYTVCASINTQVNGSGGSTTTSTGSDCVDIYVYIAPPNITIIDATNSSSNQVTNWNFNYSVSNHEGDVYWNATSENGQLYSTWSTYVYSISYQTSSNRNFYQNGNYTVCASINSQVNGQVNGSNSTMTLASDCMAIYVHIPPPSISIDYVTNYNNSSNQYSTWNFDYSVSNYDGDVYWNATSENGQVYSTWSTYVYSISYQTSSNQNFYQSGNYTVCASISPQGSVSNGSSTSSIASDCETIYVYVPPGPVDCGNTSYILIRSNSSVYNAQDVITFSVLVQCGSGENTFTLRGEVSRIDGNQNWNYTTLDYYQFSSNLNNSIGNEMYFTFDETSTSGEYMAQFYIGDASNIIGWVQWNFTVYGDDDNDGVNDQTDNCIEVNNPNQSDLDGDGLGDACDLDIDGDGVDNQNDALPNNGNESSDTDNDGLGDNTDDDDDGDGMADSDDAFPLNPTEQADLDGDGVGDNLDADDDADGITDVTDNCPLIANADQADLDGDGVGTACDGIELSVDENGTIEENGNVIPSIGMVGTVVAISAGFFIAIRREDEE